MSSTEPRLIQFELEICPLQFRLAAKSRDGMLLGYRQEDTGKRRTVITNYQDNAQLVDAMLESLHWLLQANSVLDTPVAFPASVYNPMYMTDPSVHLVFAYSDGRKWGSMYPLEELPDNIRNLVDQVKYLAMQTLQAPADDANAAS